MSQILLLTDGYLPHAGGSRVYYHNLYSRLATKGTDRITVLTAQVPGWRDFDRTHAGGGLRVKRSGRPLPDLHLRHWIPAVAPMLRAAAEILRHPADIVHCGDLFPQGIAAYLIKRMVGTPYLAFCHGEDITLTEDHRLQRPMRNAIYCSADHVVAACEFAREHLLRIGVHAERITKITPGVDCTRFTPGAKPAHLAARWKTGPGPVLLTVARLTERKGHANVLRAVAKLIHRVPDLVYLIAGTGPERSRLEQLSRELGICHAVRFLGYVAEDELASVYRLCDVFVMMNRELAGDIEGFGMVFLEASACGKPVLGGCSGGTGESIAEGETGYRIDPDDPAMLEARLEQLLANEALRLRLGEQGARYARGQFAWEARARALADLSASLLTRPAQATATVKVAEAETWR